MREIAASKAAAVGEVEARAALDALVRAYMALARAQGMETELMRGAPDPTRTFAGLEEVLAFVKARETHDGLMAEARLKREKAEAVCVAAGERCRFVPEMAALYHELDGGRYLVRREQPRGIYSGPEQSGDGTEAGGEIVFVVTYQGAADGTKGAVGEDDHSTLRARRRISVGERLSGPRRGRGAESRKHKGSTDSEAGRWDDGP